MDHAPPSPSPGVAAAMTAGIMIAVAGFIAVGTALGLSPLYGGFALLWYHATVDKFDFKIAPSALVGALGGIGMAWALQAATQSGNLPMILAVVAAMVVIVFVSVLQRLSFVINGSFMLYLTIGCAPLLQKGEDFREVIAAILLGAAYFGTILAALAWFTARRSARVHSVSDAIT
jgi:hypothetical protein